MTCKPKKSKAKDRKRGGTIERLFASVSPNYCKVELRSSLALEHRGNFHLYPSLAGAPRPSPAPVICGGSPIDAQPRFVLMCDYTGKEVVG